jgi:hypothetical protein
MRFTHLMRLMLVGKQRAPKTFELFRQYTACWEEYENVSRTQKKRFYTRGRLQKWKIQRFAELETRSAALETEISSRYEGLLKLICRQSGATADAQYGAAVVAIWDSVRNTWAEDMVLIPRDYREFPKSFWEASERNLAGDISPLKAKFMLRPFIDHLPGQDERNALLTRAYGIRSLPLTDRETFDRVFDSACQLLHQQLLQQRASVSILTDEVVTPEGLDGVTSPLEFYAGLLFPRRDDPVKEDEYL